MTSSQSRPCAWCDQPFSPPSKGSKARFCSTPHRVAAAKARRRGLPESATVTVLRSEPTAADDVSVELITLEDVAAELQRSLRSPMTPPTAKAGLAREYRATLAEIDAKRPKAKDGIDEIAERRARRSGS